MSDRMNHIDEGTIHAWLDGALPPDESSRVEGHVAGCAACRETVAEARGLIAASSRILAALDTVPAGVIPGTVKDADQLAALRQARAKARRAWWHRPGFLAAASLVFMAGTATAVWRAVDRGVPARGTAVEPVGAVERQASVDAPPPGPVPPEAVAGKQLESEVKAETPLSNRPPVARRLEAASPGERVPATDADRSREAGRQSASQQAGLPAQIADQARVAQLVGQDALQQAALVRTDSISLATAFRRAPGRPVPSHVGCYELRGPAPVSGRLLGVPQTVQLLDDPAPRGTDSTWMRATGVDSGAVETSLVWRQIDAATLELLVRRPMDSTIVRFRPVVAVPPVADEPLPAGIVRAVARRVICR